MLWGAAALAATEMYSWHGLDIPVFGNKRFQLTAHTRLRSRHELSYLDQIRVGPVLRWNASKRLIPFGGFYLQPQQVRPDTWFWGRRFFGGVEAPFRLNPKAQLTTRLVAERFINTGRPDYNRYRSSVRLVLGNGRVTPYLQSEFLAVRQGFHSMRNSGGLRYTVSPHLALEAGYLYDLRRTFWGGDRQALVTAIRWNPAKH